MSQEIINLISAIAGLIAAGGGLWAAQAAHRSAVAAQEAARHAEKVERRGALRDLIVTTHRVVAESLRVGSLVEELKAEYGLATSSGQLGGSREKFFTRRAESKLKEVASLQEEAQKLIQERAQLLNFSDEDLTQALSKFDGYLIHVRRVRNTVEREVTSVASDNRIHRESRSKANQRV